MKRVRDVIDQLAEIAGKHASSKPLNYVDAFQVVLQLLQEKSANGGIDKFEVIDSYNLTFIYKDCRFYIGRIPNKGFRVTSDKDIDMSDTIGSKIYQVVHTVIAGTEMLYEIAGLLSSFPYSRLHLRRYLADKNITNESMILLAMDAEILTATVNGDISDGTRLYRALQQGLDVAFKDGEEGCIDEVLMYLAAMAGRMYMLDDSNSKQLFDKITDELQRLESANVVQAVALAHGVDTDNCSFNISNCPYDVMFSSGTINIYRAGKNRLFDNLIGSKIIEVCADCAGTQRSVLELLGLLQCFNYTDAGVAMALESHPITSATTVIDAVTKILDQNGAYSTKAINILNKKLSNIFMYLRRD